jgi:hypothetical protein
MMIDPDNPDRQEADNEGGERRPVFCELLAK